MNNKLEKRYGLLTAICMVVGIVIGSGVFFKAQTILQLTGGNLQMGIAAWIIGGLIMLFCALAFSTMAMKYEKVNGVVDYSEATLGHGYAYYVGWFMIMIYFPAMTSVVAWVTARYTLTFMQSANPDLVLSEGGTVASAECMVLTLLFLCLSFAINALAPVVAGKVQVSTTVIKLIPLGLMAVVGLIYGMSTGQLTENFNTVVDASVSEAVEGAGFMSNPLFAAVVATSFAYEGWIVATSINAEIKDAKKNLPRALIIGAIVVITVYVMYFIGVAGGASSTQLMNEGATVAFTNIFGNVVGNILNLFIAISCFGTLNGLMLGTCRGMYSLAVRGEGILPEFFAKIDNTTKMPVNSAIFALLACSVWFAYFYFANLASGNWLGFFSFDSSELPIVTIYALYIPIFIRFMKQADDMGTVRRYVIPALAICGSLFMVVATIFSHGIKPYYAAKAVGEFSCPVLGYLIIFAVVMIIGWKIRKK